jgi:hypothetical protein
LNSGVNFLLTGEGSNLSNLETYCLNFFGSNANKKNLNNIENHDDLEKNFGPCLGALKIIKEGWETEAIPEIRKNNIDKVGFFAKIFGNRW